MCIRDRGKKDWHKIKGLITRTKENGFYFTVTPVFFDLVQAGVGVCEIEDIALSVLTSVISVNKEIDAIIVDAGWMALSSDRGTSLQKIDFGYGQVCYEDGKIIAPVDLAGGNEEQLIDIFQYVHPDDWVFASWRNHYHALLHGIPRDTLMDMIIRGKSMSVYSDKPKFYSSSIVGGIVEKASMFRCG